MSGHDVNSAERDDLMRIFYREFMCENDSTDAAQTKALDEAVAKKILQKVLALKKKGKRITLHIDVIRILFEAIDVRYSDSDALVLNFLCTFPEYVGPLFNLSDPAANADTPIDPANQLDVTKTTPFDLSPKRYFRLGEPVYLEYKKLLEEYARVSSETSDAERPSTRATWEKKFNSWVMETKKRDGVLDNMCAYLAQCYQEIHFPAKKIQQKKPEWFVSAANAAQLYAFMSATSTTGLYYHVNGKMKLDQMPAKDVNVPYISIKGFHLATQGAVTGFLGKHIVQAYKKDPKSFANHEMLRASLQKLVVDRSNLSKLGQKEDAVTRKDAIDAGRDPRELRLVSQGVFSGDERFQWSLFSKLPAIGEKTSSSEGKKLAALALQGSAFALGILNNLNLTTQLFAFLSSQHTDYIGTPCRVSAQQSPSPTRIFFENLISTAVKTDLAMKQSQRFAYMLNALLSCDLALKKTNLENYIRNFLLGKYNGENVGESPFEVYLNKLFPADTLFCSNTVLLFTEHFDFFAEFLSSSVKQDSVKKDYLKKLFRASARPLDIVKKCTERLETDEGFRQIFTQNSAEISVSLFEKFSAGEIESSLFDTCLAKMKPFIESLISVWSKNQNSDEREMLRKKIAVLFDCPALLPQLNLDPSFWVLLENNELTGKDAAKQYLDDYGQNNIAALIRAANPTSDKTVFSKSLLPLNPQIKNALAVVVAFSPPLWKQVDPFQKYWFRAMFYNLGKKVNAALEKTTMRVHWQEDFFNKELMQLEAFSPKLKDYALGKPINPSQVTTPALLVSTPTPPLTRNPSVDFLRSHTSAVVDSPSTPPAGIAQGLSNLYKPQPETPIPDSFELVNSSPSNFTKGQDLSPSWLYYNFPVTPIVEDRSRRFSGGPVLFSLRGEPSSRAAVDSGQVSSGPSQQESSDASDSRSRTSTSPIAATLPLLTPLRPDTGHAAFPETPLPDTQYDVPFPSTPIFS